MATFEDIHIEYFGVKPHAILTFAINYMTPSGLCEVESSGAEYIFFTLWHFNDDNTAMMKAVLDDTVQKLGGNIEYSVPNHGLYFERQWEESE